MVHSSEGNTMKGVVVSPNVNEPKDRYVYAHINTHKHTHTLDNFNI